MSMIARRVGSAIARKTSSEAEGLAIGWMIGFRRNPKRSSSVQRVTVVSVPVSDQRTAKAFYVESLGFELIAEAPFGDELTWIQVGPPGAQASLTLVTWFDEMPAGSLRGLVIETDDLQRDYERLIATGVNFLGPPAPQPGGTFATLRDPDGNQISLRQADSPLNLR
jgi:catechol 2,3-dioxygenase-like lactoylglutathione lyase family enzyme